MQSKKESQQQASKKRQEIIEIKSLLGQYSWNFNLKQAFGADYSKYCKCVQEFGQTDDINMYNSIKALIQSVKTSNIPQNDMGRYIAHQCGVLGIF